MAKTTSNKNTKSKTTKKASRSGATGPAKERTSAARTRKQSTGYICAAQTHRRNAPERCAPAAPQVEALAQAAVAGEMHVAAEKPREPSAAAAGTRRS